jgi:segregation and condensation protein B
MRMVDGAEGRGIENPGGAVMIEMMDQSIETTTNASAGDETRAASECANFATGEITTESVVEALLMATDEPLPAGKIALLLGTGDASDVKAHIETLNEKYARTRAAFRIEAIAKGYQVLTLPAYDAWIGKLHKARSESRLSPAALETLAIVAYKQPILRADVEAIRGVAVGDMLVRLRDSGLVRIVGRAEEVGRPLLYGTTTRFLEVFGLSSLKDLPKVDSDKPAAVPKLALAE